MATVTTVIKIQIEEIFDDHDGDRVMEFWSSESKQHLSFDREKMNDYVSKLMDLDREVHKSFFGDVESGMLHSAKCSTGIAYIDRELKRKDD